MLAFFFSVVRFLEATFLATFFFVRELGFFAPITKNPAAWSEFLFRVPTKNYQS